MLQENLLVDALDGETASGALELARLVGVQTQNLPRPLRRAMQFGKNMRNNAVRRRWNKAKDLDL